jgi:hypothetical protein
MKSRKLTAGSRLLLAILLLALWPVEQASAAKRIKLASLAKATRRISKYDVQTGTKLSEITADIEKGLNRGDKPGATQSLASFADLVFSISNQGATQGATPLNVLIFVMDAVVETESTFDLPAGVKRNKNQCCGPVPGGGRFQCQPKRRSKCFTFPNGGCIGNAC